MISNADVASLCCSIYDEPSVFDHTFSTGGIFLGTKEYDDCHAIVFRGSDDLLDWVRDIASLGFVNTDIGCVPYGFFDGIPSIGVTLANIFDTKPLVISGHSLGAAHACLLAGIVTAMTKPIDRLVLFGCPRAGGDKLKYLLSGVHIDNYRNLNDPVTDVPVLPFAMQMRDFTHLSVNPISHDHWGPIAPHRMNYYNQGLHEALADKGIHMEAMDYSIDTNRKL